MSPAAGLALGIAVTAAAVGVYRVGTDRLAFYAVSLLVLTVTWNGIRVGGGAFGDGFMLLAFAAVVTNALVTRRGLPIPRLFLVAGALCVCAGLITGVFPPATALVQKTVVSQLNFAQQDGVRPVFATAAHNTSFLIKYEASLVLIPVIIIAAATTPQRLRRLVDLWTLSAAVNGAVAILDYAGLHFTPVAFSDNRSAGLTLQSNYLALTCVLAVPTAMLSFGRSRKGNVIGSVELALLLGGVYASGSRAGFVAALLAVVGTIAAVGRLRRGFALVLPVFGMFLVLTLFFTSLGREILKQVRLSGSNTVTQSNSQRSQAASVALDQIRARPLEGVGFSVIANAHDIYLELLAAGGALTLIAFGMFCGGLASSLRRALDSPCRDLAIVLGVSVFAWLANGVFDNQLADKYLYVVPGLLWAAGRLAVATREGDHSGGPSGVTAVDEASALTPRDSRLGAVPGAQAEAEAVTLLS
jgi:hypothetical protein